MALLFEFAVQRYGRERLPDLLAQMRRPITWQTLIPAVFNVLVEEFEAGWRGWLGEEYGL
ncbi:MAG: hypothetical protein HY328_11855 [Chloroflexi bacterium]|nr:hypothetical protein [Chloroflexota bacterium]